MNYHVIHELVSCHNTNRVPAIRDEKTVQGVIDKEFSKLTPDDYQPLDREGLLKQLGLNVTLEESVLEDEYDSDMFALIVLM